MRTAYIPKRGDIVWLSFNPQAGHEQAGHRPAFVVSPEAYNRKTGLFLVCPITSKAKGYPFEITLPAAMLPNARTSDGVILADQVKILDWKARHAKFLAHAGREITEEVVSRLLPLIEDVS